MAGRLVGNPGSPARTALVSGATGGIGSAISAYLLDEAFSVTLVGRRKDVLGELASDAARRPGRAAPCVADLDDAEAPGRVVAEHLRSFGRLDLLVLAAGASRRQPLVDAARTASQGLVDANFLGPLDLLAASLPALRAAGKEHGRALVVIVASLAAHEPVGGFAVYSATKAAVGSLAKSLNQEEAAHGVRATALCPGFVDTRFARPIRDEVGGAPFLEPVDLAEAVRFLLRLSPQARVDELDIGRIGTTGAEP